MKKLLIVLSLLANVYVSFGQAKSFKFEQLKRRYIIYLPKTYNPAKTYPLIYNFHGGGMTATEQMFYTGMNATADKFNFIVVYPYGINADWNVGFDMSYLKGTNDIGFIKALNDSLKLKYSIDEKAIFATGLSRGGFLCHRLATELPTVFAAIAPVGATLPDSVKFYNQSATKVSVMLVHGTTDQIVKYDGKPNAYSSAPASFEYWVARNKLAGSQIKKSMIDTNKKDATSVTIANVNDTNASVVLVSINDGGHTWPGADPFNIGFPLGKTTADITMNDMLWDFFNKNRKKE